MRKYKFQIINGPNLNMLGSREIEHYGSESLEDIKSYTTSLLKNYPVDLSWFQSNLEGDIISSIQSSVGQELTALIINPGGYSHTSVAILDALRMIKCPIIEVHLSNLAKREDFRKERLTAKASTMVIEGGGRDSYFLAIYSQLIDKECP